MLSNYKARIRILFVSLFVLSACEGAPDPQPPKMVSEVDGKAMMLVPAGEFIMGTNRTDPENTHLKIGTVKPLYKDQHPERRVHLDAFYIDQYEVTNREYKKFVDDTQFHELPGHWEDGRFPKGKGGLPVTNVTWREALAYA
ncbi:MAG: formylglycine-generating enzyme family protein, partial [Nitrospina sp.]